MNTESTIEMDGKAQTFPFTQVRTIEHRSKAWRRRLPLAGVVLAIFVFHVGSIVRYPSIFVDEAWMASRAWAWLQTGRNVGPLDHEIFSNLDRYWAVNPILLTLVHATTIRLIGLSVISLRFVSFLAGIGLLVAIYVISLELYESRRVATITALLVATSYPFLYSSHLVRPDIFVSALGFGAIALYLVGRRRHPVILSLLAGLMIGIAFEIHPNAMIYGPIVVTLYLVDDKWQFFRKRGFWAFVGGTCLGLAGYIWLHILPNPGTYFAIMSEAQQTHMPPAASGSLATMIHSIRSMGRYLFAFTHLRILAIPVATIVLWRKTDARSKEPLVMLVVGTLTFALFVRNRLGYYVILIAPFLDIVVGMAIGQILAWRGRMSNLWLRREESAESSAVAVSLARFLGKVSIYSIVVSSLALTAITLRDAPPSEDLNMVINRVEKIAAETDLIMGSHTYWFGLYHHPYRTWQQIRAYRRFNPGTSFDEAARALHPDLLVIDEHMRSFILEDPASAPRYLQERHLLKEDVDEFLARRGKLQDRFDTAAYGTIEIYSINWDDGGSAAP